MNIDTAHGAELDKIAETVGVYRTSDISDQRLRDFLCGKLPKTIDEVDKYIKADLERMVKSSVTATHGDVVVHHAQWDKSEWVNPVTALEGPRSSPNCRCVATPVHDSPLWDETLVDLSVCDCGHRAMPTHQLCADCRTIEEDKARAVPNDPQPTPRRPIARIDEWPRTLGTAGEPR